MRARIEIQLRGVMTGPNELSTAERSGVRSEAIFPLLTSISRTTATRTGSSIKIFHVRAANGRSCP